MARRKAELGADLDDRLTPDGFTRDDADAFIRPFDAGHQAFRALGRLLLAEPEDELANLRERMLRAVAPNAGLLSSVLPEFAALLAVPPDPGDPLSAQARVERAAAAVLRAVASPRRPLWCCWGEPIENAVRQSRWAREGMLASGDVNARYTYHTTVSALLDCAPSLEVWAAEVDAGLDFVQRTDSDQTGQ
jgi:hypothetical protein